MCCFWSFFYFSFLEDGEESGKYPCGELGEVAKSILSTWTVLFEAKLAVLSAFSPLFSHISPYGEDGEDGEDGETPVKSIYLKSTAVGRAPEAYESSSILSILSILSKLGEYRGKMHFQGSAAPQMT